MSGERRELLERYGRLYGSLHLAIAFTRGTEGELAKKLGTGWPETRPLPDAGFGAGLLAERGQRRNPAVVLRPSGLIGVECDGREAVERFQALGLPPTVTVQSSAPDRLHFWFRSWNGTPPRFVSFRFEGVVTCEEGRGLLCPPAVHPGNAKLGIPPGLVYSFLRSPEDTEIAVMPEATYEELVRLAKGDDDELRQALASDPDAKIPEGRRRETIFKAACSAVRFGVPREAILESARALNRTRCDPPLTDEQVVGQVDGAVSRYPSGTAQPTARGQARPDEAMASPQDEAMASPDPPPLHAVPAEEFAAVDEASAEPLLGDTETTVLAAGGLLVAYGDGGAGKTTLILDQAVHLAAGHDWLGLPVPRPCRVLWIEDEGPRGKFREKLRAKLAAWDGPSIEGRLIVLEEPWALFTFAEEPHRRGLLELVRDHEIDVLIAGPVQRLGVEGGGTTAEVQAFLRLLDELRAELDRPLAYSLIHHENKAGDVSGAWEGNCDTLMHVQARGNGHTAVRWGKVRWGSSLHGKSWKLLWRSGEAFELDETPETTDEEIADQIVHAVRESPGASWNKIEGPLSAKAVRKRTIRDQLLADGLLVNGGTGKRMRLFLPEDLAHEQLRPEWDAPGTHPASPRGEEGEEVQVRPASLLYRDAGTDAPTSTPPSNTGTASP